MNYEVEYYRWLNEKVNDQEKALGHCEHCEKEVYPSDAHYRGLHEVIHKDCFTDFAIEQFRLEFVSEWGE